LVARSAVIISGFKQPEGFWFDPRLRRDVLLLLSESLVWEESWCFLLVGGYTFDGLGDTCDEGVGLKEALLLIFVVI
jgi:hypothetical protein